MARKIIIAKPGLDGHDRGAKVIARVLRDAGYEVVYLGVRRTPAEIVEAAIDEDAGAIGLSSHNGAHMTLFGKVLALLDEHGARDIAVFGGGIIPPEDVAELERSGVRKIFTPGTATADIVAWTREHLADEVGPVPAPQ